MARKPAPSDNGPTKAASNTSDSSKTDSTSTELPGTTKETSKSSRKTTSKKTSRGRSSTPGRPARRESNAIESSSGTLGAARMIVNYIPGDECRIAFVDNGKLEEYHAEPTGSVSRVNNIYLGVVRNVNTAVQAAFVDFGLDEHGFLHTSDVHPRYFPENEDAAERVGIKTPRRDRPPIQRCFKPGDRIMVQVLKEGVGTKGPTLTSYISIPGRYLVMMPGMDNVGVSRKVEDEDARRKMRQILDQLDLPEGFGFILRTAGMDRTKTELNKDLAYLKRLWADMSKKQKAGKAPLALYAESDLLLRALRDLAGSEVTDVIIDDPGALARTERYLKIAAPRHRPRLRQYAGKAPIFAAFGIEQQIHNIHSREVPLPSGGRLIIEETEALVAIDVNSGRSRSAKDAETNALNTNLEAVDEICRQLRLRDLGGLVINDLIDMRHARHRQAVQERFAERLKRDRAKSTILPISEFGILEMTRQRMRSSHERTHFAECHLCKGRGVIRRPDSVAAEALRDLALVASYDKVARVEMVVSAQVASHLLSGRRKQLSRIERLSGVITEVRVSETMAAERFVLHAYEANGNDIDLEKLPKMPDPEQFLIDTPGLDEAESEAVETIEAPADEEDDTAPIVEAHPLELDAEDMEATDDEPAQGERSGRRRRRRRRRGGRDRAEAVEQASGQPATNGTARPQDTDEDEDEDDASGQAAEVQGPADDQEQPRRRRRRRRRRGGRDRVDAGTDRASERNGVRGQEDDEDEFENSEPTSLARRLASALSAPSSAQVADDQDEQEDAMDDASSQDASEQDDAGDENRPRRKRRRRRRGGTRQEGSVNGTPEQAEIAHDMDGDDLEPTFDVPEDTDAQVDDADGAPDEDRPRRKRRRRRRGSAREEIHAGDADLALEVDEEAPVEVLAPEPAPAGLIEPRPKSARKEPAKEPKPAAQQQVHKQEAKAEEKPAKPRPRFLYAAHRKTRPTGGTDGG